MTEWRIWTEPGGLTWADPGPDPGALSDALRDCASTLSPRDEAPALSTYWVDRMLDSLEAGNSEVAHGNLWVVTLAGDSVEIRLDLDEPATEPVATVHHSAMVRGLRDLRAEVQARLDAGHILDDRNWSQQNPAQ